MLEEQNIKSYLQKNKIFTQWKGILLFSSSNMAAAITHTLSLTLHQFDLN